MTRTEWIMAILALAGVVVAFLTGAILWLQLDEMRTDERAWLNITEVDAHYPKDISKDPLSETLTLENTGKTAARAVSSQFILDFVVNGYSPDFVYADRIFNSYTVGALNPNSPQSIDVVFLKQRPGESSTVPRLLAQSESDDLNNGRAYLALYGRATYLDIFGHKHWMHYCVFSTSIANPTAKFPVTSKSCSDYNDTGDGDEPKAPAPK